MIIDAHHHLWDPAQAAYPWMAAREFAPIRRRFEPADLKPLLDRQGISGTIVVQARASLDETRDLLATAQRTPFILGVVGWVDLTSADLAASIAELRAGPGGELLAGVRHQAEDEADPAWLLRDDVQRGIAQAGDAGLVFDLLVRQRELPAALELVRRHPDVSFVLDHLGKPPLRETTMASWQAAIRELSESENVVCKLSGLVTEAHWQRWRESDLLPALGHALDCFGPERAIFGSDWPVCLLAAGYGRVLGVVRAALAELGESDRAAVLGGNAARVYGLAAVTT